MRLTQEAVEIVSTEERCEPVEFGHRLRELVERHFAAHPQAVFEPQDAHDDQSYMILHGPEHGVLLTRAVDKLRYNAEWLSRGLSPTWCLSFDASSSDEGRCFVYDYPQARCDVSAALATVDRLTPTLPQSVPYGVVEDGMVTALVVVRYSPQLNEDGLYCISSGTNVFVLDGHVKPALLQMPESGFVTQSLWDAVADGRLVRLGERLVPVDKARQVSYRWYGHDSSTPGHLYLTCDDLPGEPYIPGKSRWWDWCIAESYPGEIGRPDYPDGLYVSTNMGFRA